jgi:hypothetical protein
MKKIFIVLPLFLSFFGFGQIDSASIIGQSVRIGNLEVAQYDFPKRMNWHNAKRVCEGLGIGWRLPTKDELNSIYLYKKNIGGFRKGCCYWSSTEALDGNVWGQRFSFGYQFDGAKIHPNFVRAVRSVNF